MRDEIWGRVVMNEWTNQSEIKGATSIGWKGRDPDRDIQKQGENG